MTKYQKVKNKKIIGFIYTLLSIFLGIGLLSIVISLVLFFLTLFKPDFEPFYPVIDVPIEIHEEATVELRSGAQYNILIDEAYFSFNVDNPYGFTGVVNYLYFTLILAVAVYIIYLLWKIFRSIRTSLKDENPFHHKNTWRIRKIAIAIFVSAILEISYPLFIKFLWLKKIIAFDQAFTIRLNLDASIDLFWALIVLVVAEIYRIGLEIKKEQELTI
ncbi:MAG: DUF2975 domain-containing protein [Bacteroidales bacterium]|jgi:hypothetical protein|nr:DUF2975 domain-containing protein [Bacteroidales bacterium]